MPIIPQVFGCGGDHCYRPHGVGAYVVHKCDCVNQLYVYRMNKCAAENTVVGKKNSRKHTGSSLLGLYTNEFEKSVNDTQQPEI